MNTLQWLFVIGFFGWWIFPPVTFLCLFIMVMIALAGR